jgi:hypothetical protein
VLEKKKKKRGKENEKKNWGHILYIHQHLKKRSVLHCACPLLLYFGHTKIKKINEQTIFRKFDSLPLYMLYLKRYCRFMKTTFSDYLSKMPVVGVVE